jgi:hypothetical protein
MQPPQGLRIVGDIEGSSYEECGARTSYTFFEKRSGRPIVEYDSQSLVSACLTVANTTSSAILFNIPPGTIFRSRSESVQDGLLTYPVSVRVPARSRTNIFLSLFCMDSDKEPSSGSDAYIIDKSLSKNPALKELINIIKNKNITGVDEFRAVQIIIWDIIDDESKRLSPEQKQILSKL